MGDQAIILDGVSDPRFTYELVVDAAEQVGELHDFLLRNSLAYFAKHMLYMDVSSHHLEWSEGVSEYDRLCIVAARDHGKSAFFSYALPIWEAWKKPGSLGYLMSASASLAGELLEIIKYGNETLTGLDSDDSPLSFLVPDRSSKTEWSKRQIRLTNGSVIRARGFGTRVRSGHPDWIVCDDVLDESDLYSAMQREKRKVYFKTALVNMVLKTGRIVAVGTPFHKEDLYGWLSKNPVYHHMVSPGLVEDAEAPVYSDGKRYKALYPDRHSVEDLLKKKAEIGSVSFAREILCQAITNDMSLFPTTLFVGDVMAEHVTWAPTLQEIRSRGWEVFIGVDLAISASAGADYTVITVIAEDIDQNKYLIDSRRVKGKAFQEQKQLIIDMNTLYEPSLVIIEDNQMQRIFGDELIRTTDVPVKKFTTRSDNKNSWQHGVPGLRILLENAKLRLARGCPDAIRATDVYIEELTSFGWINGRLQGASEHDDCVMSLWLAMEACKVGGFKFSFGPNENDRPSTAYAGPVDPTIERSSIENADRAALAKVIRFPGR